MIDPYGIIAGQDYGGTAAQVLFAGLRHRNNTGGSHGGAFEGLKNGDAEYNRVHTRDLITNLIDEKPRK